MYKPYDVLVLGGIIMDRYIVVEKYPKPGQDTFIKEEFENVGGCPINVSFTLKNLGCKPCLVSALGSDKTGNKILSYLREKKLESPLIKQLPNRQSGYCLTILDKSGERTFFSKRGCENIFSPEMLDEEKLKEIKYVYVTGYYLLEQKGRKAIIESLIQLKQNGCTILFDPGPLIDQIAPNILSSILSIANIITPNIDEVGKIVHLLKIQKEFHEWCFNKGVSLVIIKKGAEGAVAFEKNRMFSLPAYDAPVFDTSGAGDSFAGGIIAGLIHGYDFEKSIEIGSACGAIVTAIKGPHGDFSWNDVNNTIKEKEVVITTK